jgi:hypothetical protein
MDSIFSVCVSLLYKSRDKLTGSPLIGNFSVVENFEIPTDSTSPTHTGAVTAISPSGSVTLI